MFNENSETCILLRGWLNCGVRWSPFVFLCFGWGCPLEWISWICLCVFERGAAHKNCRTELRRPHLPRRSDAEIFIRCLFSFSPWRKKNCFQFSKQCRLCVWLTFFIFQAPISDTLQSEWVSHRGEGKWKRGLDGWSGYSLRPVYFKRSVSGRMFSPSSWTNLLLRAAVDVGILRAFTIDQWDLEKEVREKLLWLLLSECEFTHGYLEFKNVYLIGNYAQKCVHFFF